MSDKTIGQCNFPVNAITELADKEVTPVYIYDQKRIENRCEVFMNMPNAFGILPRFAMKANSSRALLQLITSKGLGIDASSLNEVRRAHLAGIPYSKILLTTQEAPTGSDLEDLVVMIKNGLKYNVCSLTQLKNIAPRINECTNKFGIRIHPGVGSGESATRNTGDKYSCFGIHLTDLPKALSFAKDNGVIFNLVHVHIGSGGDPAVWKENIDRELGFIYDYFPDAETVNFGGGFKEARMPGDTAADVEALGNYAKEKIIEFQAKTDRKLKMEVEPGTYIVANSGYLVTKVADIKQTGADGFTFLVLNGGMEVNSRPLLYGSQHPFYIVTPEGEVVFDQFKQYDESSLKELIVVGRCCESGDSYTLDDNHTIITRDMKMPSIGDYFIVGGAGAYCSSMTPFNYNSHQQIAEYLLTNDGKLKLIRSRQKMEQIVVNELSL